jgi:hypothetical protein
LLQQIETKCESAKPGKLLALFPLAMVFAAITFLALGANMKASEPAVVAVAQAAPNGDADARAEEAAAAAVVAISLARVAPALPEEALEPPKAKPQPTAPEAQRKPAPARRDAAPQLSPQRAAAPAPTAVAHEQSAKPVVETKPEDGLFARVASYAPSPRKIVSAMGDGVSKLTSYIPGL